MSDASPTLEPKTSRAGEWTHDGLVVSVDDAKEYARLAVLAERERCAKLCETMSAFDMYDPGSSAAAAIRAGTTQQEKS
jgi:hypothetical protein